MNLKINNHPIYLSRHGQSKFNILNDVFIDFLYWHILGLTIIEALVSTVVVGIGFIAVFQMTNFSVRSIDTSSERTKANYLVSMMAEDVLGHSRTVHGVNTLTGDYAVDIDGSIQIEGVKQPTARLFTDHLAAVEFS